MKVCILVSVVYDSKELLAVDSLQVGEEVEIPQYSTDINHLSDELLVNIFSRLKTITIFKSVNR